MSRTNTLYRSVLVTLNIMFFLEIAPNVVANIDTIVYHNGTFTAPSPGDAVDDLWLRWVYVINSFVVLGSSFLAVCAVFMANHRPGRFILWLDMLIKFISMVAYAVLVGFRVKFVIGYADGARDVAGAMALVYAAGVMGFVFCLATAIWELKFLLWRKRSQNGNSMEEAGLVNYTYI